MTDLSVSLSLHQSLQKILFDRVQQNADIVNGFRHLVLVTLTRCRKKIAAVATAATVIILLLLHAAAYPSWVYARTSLTTVPCTSVKRKLRP